MNLTPDLETELHSKLESIEFEDYEVVTGVDDIPMLHVEGHFISGVLYALSLSDEKLKDLIEETLLHALE